MKKLLSILVLLLSLNTLAQGRLGYSYSELFTEFESNIASYENNTLLLEFAFFHVSHVFNENNVCVLSVIYVNTKEKAQYFFNKYNTEFITINGNKWIAVYEGFNTICEARYINEKSVIAFTWSYE
jgi:hypothetical protein